ncbi:glycosyltransferase family 2 protein [Flavitalea antarctica]
MISIITPTYNRALLVQTTIKSIQAQTFKDWELIIVDDGSTDNTEEAIQHFLEDSRIRYVKKSNSGQAASLNVGVQYAKYDFITFLDSDDEAYPEWLQTVTREMNNETGIACSCAIRKFIDGSRVEEGLGMFNLFGEKMMLKFTCGSLFIRKSLFHAIGGYDVELRANIQTDLGYRLIDEIRKTDYKIVTVRKFLIQINIHAGERIRTNWQRKSDGGAQFLKKHFAFLQTHDPKEISNICATIAFSNYKMNDRKKSMEYLLKAIKHNPTRILNYLRIVKYRFM